MGNRTSGRAESFHSDLKRASGSQFASRLALVCHRMNAYYDQKRADRYRKLEIERIKKIPFSRFISKCDNCNCWDRIRFKLPCPCIISISPLILPLSIVDGRWRFERDENFEDNDSNEITSNGTNAKYASDEDQNEVCDANLTTDAADEVVLENSDTINKDRLLLRVEKLLHEISDAIKALELAKSSIWAPPIRMDELKPPYVNSNRKGRKAKQGVKSSTESLQISKESFDEFQTKNIKEKERKRKKIKISKRKRKLLELEEMQLDIDQKKRKLTLVETYRDPKTDAVFRWTGITPIDAIAAIHNVDADGNCGFRAISFDTYKD
ncbi:hypothetical protein EDC94DRAFT_656322 [Helicostylum pulchrum]|nr:hypothetical protein EDC94DRAFT_656322 [Helicostylum pulchrum]